MIVGERAGGRVVQRQPWSAKGRLLLALAYRERGVPDVARQLAADAVELDPSYADARSLLAELTPGGNAGGESRP